MSWASSRWPSSPAPASLNKSPKISCQGDNDRCFLTLTWRGLMHELKIHSSGTAFEKFLSNKRFWRTRGWRCFWMRVSNICVWFINFTNTIFFRLNMLVFNTNTFFRIITNVIFIFRGGVDKIETIQKMGGRLFLLFNSPKPDKSRGSREHISIKQKFGTRVPTDRQSYFSSTVMLLSP